MSRGRDLRRKSIHVALGGFALTLRWLLPWQAAAGALAALLFNLLLVHRLTRRAVLRPHEEADGFSWGITLYPAAVLGAILVFHERMELAAAVWGVLAFGDGMAAISGILLGGPRLAWNPRKSWAGLIAFLAWGTVSAAVLIRWTQLGVLDGRAAGQIGASFLDSGRSARLIQDDLFLVLGCLAAVSVAALFESLDTRLDDNLSVPVVAGAMLYAATWVEPFRLLDDWPVLLGRLPTGVGLTAGAGVAALTFGAVNRSGAVVGALLGTMLFVFAGWSGLSLLALLVVIGSAVTRLGYAEKRAAGIAEEREGRRSAGSALANTGAGVLFAILAVSTPFTDAFRLAMVAVFATALADTAGSEIGKAFGRPAARLVPPGRVAPGTPGAVSLAGSSAALLAAALIAGVGWLGGTIDAMGVLAVTTAAMMGATAESIAGGLWRTTRPADHDLFNFSNTLCGAGIAVAIYSAVV